MFDPPVKQKPRRYQHGGVEQVDASSTSEEHTACLSDANFISLRLFAWQLSDSLTAMPNCCRFLTWCIYLVVDAKSDVHALVGDRDVFGIYRPDTGGAPIAIGGGAKEGHRFCQGPD
jgi:hypothetical protein